jgi:hypothetical protein
MKIADALKLDGCNISVACGDRRLYWDETVNQYFVLEKRYHKKSFTCVIMTDSEDVAVEELIKS